MIIQGFIGVAIATGPMSDAVFYDSGFATPTSYSTTYTTITDGTTPLEFTLYPSRTYHLRFHLRVARDGNSATHRIRLLASADPAHAVGAVHTLTPLADSTDPMTNQTGQYPHFLTTDLDTTPSAVTQLQTSGASPAAASKFDGSFFYRTGAGAITVSIQHSFLTGTSVLGVRKGTWAVLRELTS